MSRTPLSSPKPASARPAPGHVPVQPNLPAPPSPDPRTDAEAELLAGVASRVLGAR